MSPDNVIESVTNGRGESMRKAILVGALVGLLLGLAWPWITNADARNGCNSRACEERVARKQCSQTRVVPCIRRAALHYRQSFPDMLRVARCESSLDPYNEYAGHRGLFQFNYPGTWNTTKYAKHDPYSAKWNSLAAAWMWSRKPSRRNEWACR